ncbi:MAG: ABC transporter substrate-binding protein, partial [Gemmatimonadaceae bacterium]
FVPVWEEPLMTVGAGSFLSELVGIAGGRNVYDDETAPSLTVSLEDVIRRDPDLVLAGPNMVARIRSEPRWQALRAVRQRHVVAFDTTLVSQPSTRLGQAARSIERLLQLATR